jgi:hypothetical protein
LALRARLAEAEVMPVLDASALESDPKGMALLADVLRPAKRAKRRNAPRPWPLPTHEAPAMGRELVEHEAEEQPKASLLTPAG